MKTHPILHLVRSITLLLGIQWAGAVKAQGELKLLADIFSPEGAPSVQGKAWVTVDCGPENWQSEIQGWIIQDSPRELLLLESDGDLKRLRKPSSDEERPRLKENADGSIPWGSHQSSDFQVAWKVREADYSARSRKFLAGGLPDDENCKGVYGFVNERFGLADHIVESARYAHFASQLGRKVHAEELYDLAVRGYERYLERYSVSLDDPPKNLHTFVADRIASRSRNAAIHSAHGGSSREEILVQWEIIADLPYHRFRDESKAMVEHYRRLLEEDTKWNEPNAEKVASFTVEEKVAYWLHHLRDLDVGQWSDPGHCSVFNEFGVLSGEDDQRKPNPAVELKKLGLAAVPQLIEHLDDARPTRCKGHWRSYWPEAHYLLRYGDCCQQIFESITGHTIFQGTTTVSYPIHDGAAKLCREKAEEWWGKRLRRKTQQTELPNKSEQDNR